MTIARLICGVALCASTAATGAEPVSFPGNAKTPALGRPSASVRLEYTDFSKLFGDRAVLTADTKLGIGKKTRLSVGVSQGQRRGSGETIRSTQGDLTVEHRWSDRLSSRTAASAATSRGIFAKAQLEQGFSYKIAGGLVGTVGGKYASYGNGNEVATWSAGASYNLRGAALSYRYSLLASRRLGRSNAHLASVRIKDPASSGSTQLWVSHGTSLYEADLPSTADGKFTSIALQRSQPLGGGIAVDVGVSRGWYKTPRTSYRATGLVAGLRFSKWPL